MDWHREVGESPKGPQKINTYKDNFTFEKAILDWAFFPLLWSVHSTRTQLEGVLPNVPAWFLTAKFQQKP